MAVDGMAAAPQLAACGGRPLRGRTASHTAAAAAAAQQRRQRVGTLRGRWCPLCCRGGGRLGRVPLLRAPLAALLLGAAGRRRGRRLPLSRLQQVIIDRKEVGLRAAVPGRRLCAAASRDRWRPLLRCGLRRGLHLAPVPLAPGAAGPRGDGVGGSWRTARRH